MVFSALALSRYRGTWEKEKARLCGLFRHAPKRTRTSTRLSRTRPSTWRVYQFRHRRRRRPSIALPAAAVESVQPPRYCPEQVFDRTIQETGKRMDIGKDLTKRQQEIFDFIKRYSAKYGYPPTEIRRASTSSI